MPAIMSRNLNIKLYPKCLLRALCSILRVSSLSRKGKINNGCELELIGARQ